MINTLIQETITLVAPVTHHDKVSSIKAIRTLTGLGLKEAKDASERPGTKQSFRVVSGMSPAYFNENIRTLEHNGYRVSASVVNLLDELRKLAGSALEIGEDELASDITQLVIAQKLRRGV